MELRCRGAARSTEHFSKIGTDLRIRLIKAALERCMMCLIPKSLAIG